MLRTRLLLNLLPFVVMLLATGFYASVLFSRLTGSLDATVTQHYRSVVSAQQMLLALAEIDRRAWASAGTTNGGDQKLAVHRKQFEASLALQLGSAPVPGEKEINRQLMLNYRAFTNALARLGSLQSPEARNQVYDREFTPHMLQVKAQLERIMSQNQRAILATTQEIRNLTRDMYRLMLLGVIMALAIAAYSSYQLSRSVLGPIQLVTKATRALGEGNLDQTVPVLSRDELGELALAFNRLAGQLREYRQSTTEEIVRLHRTMETTLASFPDPIFVLNKEGGIELRNPAAAELADNLGLNGKLPERLQLIAQKTLDSGEHFLPHSFDAAVTFRTTNAEKSFLPRILTMRDKQDSLFGVAVVLYDVTRFRLLDAAKTDLVATVSHELKSPLTSVRMSLHLLLERSLGALNPRQAELVETARDDAERLLRILNDLLDLARLEGGNAALRRESVMPDELVQAMVTETADAAQARGLKITWLLDEDLPAVWVDRQRIRHVFSNLIANAIKHSPPGGQIHVRAERAAENAVEFSVIDEGPGIPEEYQSRIFERFFRVPSQTRQGAGLGLSIAREIALAHGGRIGVRSTPGHGATFFVILETAEALSETEVLAAQTDCG